MTTRLAAILVTTVVVAGVAPAAQAADHQSPFVKPSGSTAAARAAVVDARPDTYVVREDTRLVLGPGKGLLANDRGATGADQLLHKSGVGTGKLRANGSFTFVPKKAGHGLEVFTYRATGATGTDRASVRVRVLYVNDAPSFVMESLPSGLSATEDTASPAVDVVKSTAPAPAGQRELTQRVRVKVTTADSKMFAKAPWIDKFGMLTYVLAKDASGTATLVLTPKDSGGTANGGRDLGKSRTLVLNVAPVNDAPVLQQLTAKLPAVVGTPVTLTAVATDADAGDVLSYSFDCDGDGVFEVGPQAAATTSCTFATVGDRTVTAKVTDKSGATSTKQLIVSVQRQADVAPVAVNDSATVAEDSAATAVNVLANDTDADGGPIGVTAATQPVHGTVVVAADGSGLTYRPNADFNGTDSFSYTVNGGSTAVVTMNVSPVDDKPVAVNDSATVAEDAAATAVNVLANDTDIDAGPKTITSVTQPTNGAVVITGGGTGLTFKPNADFNGTSTFTYTLNGGSTATVTMTVTPVDDKPVAVNDSVTVDEDAAATVVDVLDNDTDTDAGPLAVTAVGNAAHGTVELTDGEVSYEPAADFNGTDSFTYTLNGGSTATVTVTVDPVDDKPVAVNDSLTIDEDAAATVVDVLDNDTDIDAGPLGVTAVGEADHGTVELTDGEVSYEPAADFSGTDSFTYTVNGGSSATVTVTVDPVDDKALAHDDTFTVDEDAAATEIDVLANDTDVDGTPAVSSVGDATHGTVDLTGGVVIYTPDANFHGTDSFDYTLDGGSTAIVTMTVTPVDDQAVAHDDSFTVDEDAAATEIDVLANDTDVDGDSIEVTDVGNAAHGTVTLTDGVVTYEPNANFNGTDSFDYTVTDGDTATVEISVTAVDDQAVAVDDSFTVDEDAAATAVNVLANDTDVEDDTIEVTGVGNAAHGTVTLTDGVVTYEPNANFNGTDSFDYTVTDGDTATVTMTVTAVDDKALAHDDSFTVDEDAAGTALNVLANDTDADGDTIEVTGVGNATHGTVTLTAGVVTYKPNANYNGSDSFTYAINGGSTATVTMTVTPVDDAPVAANDAATVLEDAAATAVNVLTNDTDIDGGPKTIASVTQPTNGTVVITGGGTGLTYKPNANFNGTSTFTYTLNGGSTATVTMTVTAVDDAPVAVNDSFTVAEDSGATTLDVLANDTDIDSGQMKVASVTQPANGFVAITQGGNRVTYQPKVNFFTPLNTPDTFTYTLNGGATATVSMTVTPVNDNFQPTITNPGTAPTYKLNDPAVAIAPSLVVTHPDLPYFTGASVTNGTPIAGDALTFTPKAGIVGTFAGSVLTFTGQASVADYQEVLRSVKFSATQNAGTTNITFRVTDGTRSATRVVAVTITN